MRGMGAQRSLILGFCKFPAASTLQLPHPVLVFVLVFVFVVVVGNEDASTIRGASSVLQMGERARLRTRDPSRSIRSAWPHGPCPQRTAGRHGQRWPIALASRHSESRGDGRALSGVGRARYQSPHACSDLILRREGARHVLRFSRGDQITRVARERASEREAVS
ncbi:hypothetical protein BC628DRAFT_1045180 [Trametes gibbosa]|nr:hypothetical protein BC628DRAFT_1045180 [Trametes gibbosa]